MERYLPLKRRSSELGDEYYRCLARSLRNPQEQGLAECVEIGRRYKAALRKQLRDLKRLTDQGFVERERSLVDGFLKLIDHDLKNLKSRDLELLQKAIRRRPPFDQ